MMRSPLFRAAFLVLLAGCTATCAGRAIKPAEVLDEQTGMTVGALQEPIEFVESTDNASAANAKRTSFAYLGPIEWDRMGEITYGLWIHVAPGNDRQIGSLRARGALTLLLDDGTLALSVIDTPGEGHGPYKPVASWGQTAYFALTLDTLKHIAASQKLVLEFHAVDESKVAFLPSHATTGTLSEFVRTRSVTGD